MFVVRYAIVPKPFVLFINKVFFTNAKFPIASSTVFPSYPTINFAKCNNKLRKDYNFSKCISTFLDFSEVLNGLLFNFLPVLMNSCAIHGTLSVRSTQTS